MARLSLDDADARLSSMNIARPAPRRLSLEEAESRLNPLPPVRVDAKRRSTLPLGLDDALATYEKKPITEVAGERLKAGVQNLAAGQKASSALLNARTLNAYDKIDRGETLAGDELSLAADYAAAPNRRAALRTATGQRLTQSIEGLAERNAASGAIPRNPAAVGAADAKSFGEFWEYFAKDPLGVIGQIGTESLPAAAVSIPTFGAASFPIEYGSSTIEALRDMGIDTTKPDAVATALRDPATAAAVQRVAAIRSSIIGAGDVASFGLASKTLAPVGLKPVARQLVNVPAQTAAQAAIGGGAEAAGQIASGQEFKPGQVMAEAVGELITAPGEVAGAAIATRGAKRLTLEQAERRLQKAVAGTEASAAPSLVQTPAEPARAPQAPPASPSSRKAGEPSTVLTPRGRRVEVQAEIVELDQLVTSQGADGEANAAFPQDLQPRDRTRAASQTQIASIAGDLKPELLGAAPTTDQGAPIVGPDNVVESGNGRTLALARAYSEGGEAAQRYRAYLEAQGFDLGAFRNPVLVRRRTTPLDAADRLAFVRDSNERTTLAMSTTETAKADAAALPDALIEQLQSNDLAAASNRPFIRQFLDRVASPAEVAQLVTADGQISLDGVRRVQNALFARAYDAPEVLAGLREDGDTNVRAIGEGLMDAAPAWSRLRQAAAQNRIPASLDITAALRQAVQLVSRARAEKLPLADLVNQRGLFGDVPPTVRSFLGLLFRDASLRQPAGRQRIAEALRRYATEAQKAQGGPALFDMPPVTPEQLIETARTGGQGALLPEDGIAASMGPQRPPGGTSATPPLTTQQLIERGRAAATRVLDTENDVAQAAWTKELGWIDFRFGIPGDPAKRFVNGAGLKHIELRRNLEGKDGRAFVTSVLPEILAKGTLKQLTKQSVRRRAIYEYRGNRAVVALYRYGDQDSWVVTAYEIGEKGGAGGTEGGSPQPPYASDPPNIGGQMGAAPEGDIAPRPVNDKPKRISLDEMDRRLSSLPPEVRAQAGLAMVPGSAYVGMRTDGFSPDEARGQSAPLRREAILRKISEAFDVPLYFGRIRSSRMLGFMRPKNTEVRIKKHGDLEVVAHELAHVLDDRIPEIRKQWNPASNANAAVREELASISYDQTKLFEGFAEFVRLWATQNDLAKAKAPTFHAWFESFLGRSEYGPALRDMQTEMTSWFEQDALSRARSKIGDGGDPNDWLTGWRDQLRQSLFDDLHGILRMERDLEGEIQEGGAYVSARLTRGAMGIVQGSLQFGYPVLRPDGATRFAGKGLRDILAPVRGDLDDWTLYAVGRSAAELKLQGRENLFTDSEIAAMRALETPAFRRAFEEYQAWNSGILDYAQAKGIIDPDKRAMWKRAQYLPFHRVTNPKGQAMRRGEFRGIKALTGGTGNIRDVLDNMVSNAAMLIQAAEINEARVKVAQLANQKGGAKFLARIPTDTKTVTLLTEQVMQQLAKSASLDEVAALQDMFEALAPTMTFFLTGQAPTGKDVVAVLRKGKPVYFEVIDPLVYRALASLNRRQAGGFVRALNAVRRVGQASITIAVDFITANAVRDTLSGWVMSRDGFKPFVDTARGLKSRVMKDQAYRDYVANGGSFASHLLEEGAFRADLAGFYGRKGIDWNTVLHSPQKLLLGLEAIADASEMATRIGEFRKAREAGKTARQAAYQAREVSTDFAMRGDPEAADNVALRALAEFASFLYDTAIFVKAAAVSMDRFYRGVVRDPHRANIWFKTGLIAALSAALYAINRDNPLYDELEDWDRDAHWHLFVPTKAFIEALGNGGALPPLEDRWLHLRMPKIWEIGAVSSIAERQVEGILSGKPGEAAAHSLRVILDLFKIDAVPQALKGLYEENINRNRFMDRPIVPRGLEDAEPWAQTGPSTSEALRWAGEQTRNLPPALQISPILTEHYIRSFFNSWGMYGLQILDGAFFHDNAPELRGDQLPVLRRFMVEHPARNTRYLTEVYDLIAETNQVYSTFRLLNRTNRPDLAEEFETREELQFRGLASEADKGLQQFTKAMRNVRQSRSADELLLMAEERAKATGNMSLFAQARAASGDAPKLKRLLIDDFLRERNEFARKVIDARDQFRAENSP
jgi:hypothetical protein